MWLVEEGVSNPQGEALVAELRWIHDIIRTNLATIIEVIGQIRNGVPLEQVRTQLDELAATSVVWTLRVNCMRYCSLVHGHHHHEDVGWFPVLRRLNPELQAVIDKLEADHTIVSGYLDSVEAAAMQIVSNESARIELAEALSKLAAHLLTHLDYEEASLMPTLRRISV